VSRPQISALLDENIRYLLDDSFLNMYVQVMWLCLKRIGISYLTCLAISGACNVNVGSRMTCCSKVRHRKRPSGQCTHLNWCRTRNEVVIRPKTRKQRNLPSSLKQLTVKVLSRKLLKKSLPSFNSRSNVTVFYIHQYPVTHLGGSKRDPL
jgi:hypothetical protein